MTKPNYLIVDLFQKKVSQTVATEQDACQAVAGTNGAIVIDRLGRRVYDGEYEAWFALDEYLNHFPAAAWIKRISESEDCRNAAQRPASRRMPAIENWFDFSLLQSAPAGALIACRPEDGAQALLIVRQPDGGVDDTRLTGYEDFFPVSMVTKEGFNGFLEGGDWTVIPYVRQQAADYGESYRSYMLLDGREGK